MFLYTGYIRVYPALILKILAKKKNGYTPLKKRSCGRLTFFPLLTNGATLFWQCRNQQNNTHK